ncbi:hypothetical protein [Xanthomonas floridensis]
MHPKLRQASGLDYRGLITQLIELALQRHADDQLLRSAVDTRA